VTTKEDEMEPEHERLDVLIGVWKTEGLTRESPRTPALRIDAVDTYEWLPGGFGVLHRVDAHVGEDHVEGAEIIGYDPERGAYVTQYFGSDGPSSYEATLEDRDGTLVWTMRSRSDRFTGMFDDSRERITGHWEQLEEGTAWRPWMDITLTKQAPAADSAAGDPAGSAGA
jgi:hypothetical protein